MLAHTSYSHHRGWTIALYYEKRKASGVAPWIIQQIGLKRIIRAVPPGPGNQQIGQQIGLVHWEAHQMIGYFTNNPTKRRAILYGWDPVHPQTCIWENGGGYLTGLRHDEPYDSVGTGEWRGMEFDSQSQ